MTPQAKRFLTLRVLAGVGAGLCMMSQSVSAACLLKPTQMNGATVYTLVVAPEQEVSEYLSLGFSRATCPTDMSLVRQYVDRLCADPNTVPAPNTDVLVGRPRARVCASGRAGLTEAAQQ